ncbi:MAG: hypothetical protein A2Z35_02335 [Actinobacteria bacterium RBG_19FT_COMBO_36_27]|nr:MAG: hypothetical protein A2Z35_02335 [Actinobacteria bacterium RBG_19FT_COMBO_36_27]
MAEEKIKSEGKKGPCRCPYCDMELDSKEIEFCSFCNFKVSHCPSCSYPVSDKMIKCPNCGAKL